MGDKINVVENEIEHERESCRREEKKNLKSYQCKMCNKVFPSKCRLVRHEVVHTGKKPYECELCKKSFPYRSGLNRHYRTHSGNPVYECAICKKLYISEVDLKVHLQKHSAFKTLAQYF